MDANSLVDRCKKDLTEGLKMFGTYSFDDKGADEVMDIDELVTMFRKVTATVAAEALLNLASDDHENGRCNQLAMTIVGELEDWDELFAIEGVDEVYDGSCGRTTEPKEVKMFVGNSLLDSAIKIQN